MPKQYLNSETVGWMFSGYTTFKVHVSESFSGGVTAAYSRKEGTQKAHCY